jgi:hypothetical protein
MASSNTYIHSLSGGHNPLKPGLKGTLYRDFLRQALFINHLPPGPDNPVGVISIFSKISADIRNLWCLNGVNNTGTSIHIFPETYTYRGDIGNKFSASVNEFGGQQANNIRFPTH